MPKVAKIELLDLLKIMCAAVNGGEARPNDGRSHNWVVSYGSKCELQ